MIEIVCLVNSIGNMLNTRAEKYNLKVFENFGQNSPELNEKKIDVKKVFL